MPPPGIKTLDDLLFRCEPIPVTGCWIWMGSTNGKPDGEEHGRTRFQGFMEYVHRVSWRLKHKKKVPKRLVVDHLCKVRLCCNPDHLEAVTNTENVSRGDNFMAETLRKHYPPEKPAQAPLEPPPAFDPFELVDLDY